MTRAELNDMTYLEVQREFDQLPTGLQMATMIEAILGSQCEFCHRIYKPGHFCFEGFGVETAEVQS